MNSASFLIVLPIMFCLLLIIWHVFTLLHYSLAERVVTHSAVLGLGAAIGFVSLLYYDAKNSTSRYLEKLIAPSRTVLIGISCVLIAGTHFITFSRGEPVYLQIGFIVMVLGYYETATIANRFRPHFSRGSNPVSMESVRNLLVYQILLLFLVFVLSVGGLYLSLMGVLGFTSVWSVLLLACLLFLILAAMTKVKKI